MLDNILEFLSDLFLGNGLVVIIGCFVIGMFVKGSCKKIPNNSIPYINAISAVIIGFLIPDTFDDKPIATKIILLAFMGLSSVGLYEALCIIVKERFSIDINKIYNNMINRDKGNDSSQAIGGVPQNKDMDIDVPIKEKSDSEE